MHPIMKAELASKSNCRFPVRLYPSIDPCSPPLPPAFCTPNTPEISQPELTLYMGTYPYVVLIWFLFFTLGIGQRPSACYFESLAIC